MQIRFDTITMLKIEDISDGFPFCVHIGIYLYVHTYIPIYMTYQLGRGKLYLHIKYNFHHLPTYHIK
jgi:hypothetical protein